MTQWLWYNIVTEEKQASENSSQKGDTKMTGELRNVRDMRNEDMGIVCDKCNCSAYTMASVIGCVLLCVGIVIYALLTA